MFLHFTFASNSQSIIKTCVNNHRMERQKERGEKGKVRRVHEEGCLCESVFLRIASEGGRQGWVKKKVPQSLKVKLIFSSCRRTHVGSRCESQLWQREEIVLQHRELHPLQVTQKHYSSVLRTRDGSRHVQARTVQPRDWSPLTSVRYLTDLNQNMNEDQRSGRLWRTTSSILSVSAELNHHVFAAWSRCLTDSVTPVRQQQNSACTKSVCFSWRFQNLAVSLSKIMPMLYIPPYGGKST